MFRFDKWSDDITIPLKELNDDFMNSFGEKETLISRNEICDQLKEKRKYFRILNKYPIHTLFYICKNTGDELVFKSVTL